MDYKLEKVTINNKNILYRLLQYSLFEESENDLNEMNDEGLFEKELLLKFWTNIKEIGKLVHHMVVKRRIVFG